MPYTFLETGPPKPGTTWKFNLTGHQAGDLNQYITWNPTYGGFQNPERFATITFGR